MGKDMEIEKKFKVKKLPENLERFQKKEIEQGYLCTCPTIRIRKSNDQYILTYKARLEGAGESADGVCANHEMEMPLTAEGYLHLKEKIDGYLIEKTRYLVPLADGHLAELDIFHKRLDGLYFVEVEFSDGKDAEQFCVPEWFGENVSYDPRYTNSFLSGCESLAVFQSQRSDMK